MLLEYGPVVWVQLGRVKVLFLNDPEVARKVMQDLTRRPPIFPADESKADLAPTNEPWWHTARQLLQRAIVEQLNSSALDDVMRNGFKHVVAPALTASYREKTKWVPTEVDACARSGSSSSWNRRRTTSCSSCSTPPNPSLSTSPPPPPTGRQHPTSAHPRSRPTREAPSCSSCLPGATTRRRTARGSSPPSPPPSAPPPLLAARQGGCVAGRARRRCCRRRSRWAFPTCCSTSTPR